MKELLEEEEEEVEKEEDFAGTSPTELVSPLSGIDANVEAVILPAQVIQFIQQ